MKITIYQNREVYKEESKIGNDSENKVETLEFEFPEEYKDFTKYIEFQTKDEKYVDLIEDDKYIITRAIAKYGKIKAQIVLRNSLENDVAVFKSDIFELKVSKSINATIDVPIEYPTWIDNLTRLKQDIEHAEHERVSNEEERQTAEEARQENFTEMQKTVKSAVSNIKDLKEDYNTNAKKKTDEFNNNFEEKQKAINDNAEAKTTAFGENAEAQTKTFNTNSDDKLAEYNRNHTDKIKEYDDNSKAKLDAYNKNDTDKINAYNANDIAKTKAYNDNTVAKEKSYDDNATTKTETFNSNATDKQNEFDKNAADKLAEYNQNAKELINKVEQVQAENETLKAENKLIKEQIPSASASGNSIHVEDSGTLDFDWKINGGHKQATREGYQLLNLQSGMQSGITYYVDDEGYFCISGTCTSDKITLNLNELVLNGTYTFTNKSISGEAINCVLKDNTPEYKNIFTKNNETKEVNTVLKDLVCYLTNGATYNSKIKLMLVSGSQEKDIEPYGVSPSPNYLSEVETVGSNVNLCDNSKILVGVDPKDSSEKDFRTSDYIKVEYGKSYIASLYNEKKVRIGNLVYQEWNKNLEKLQQITTDTIKITNQDIAYVTVRNYKNNAEEIKNKFYYKFEESLIATPYSPYGMGSAEIKVDNGLDTTDINYKSQTKVLPIQQEMLEGDYVADVEHHEWEKLVLTGNENFVQIQNANKLNYFYLELNSAKLRGKTISNMLKNVKSGELWDKTSYDDIVSSGSNSKTINVMLSDTTITTLQQFKEKLKELYNAETPIIIYYERATPVNLELTEEQKSIREQKMYTYKNITNISLSDELASIDVEYKKDPTTEHDDLQNQIDEIKQLLSTTQTSALLLDNLQKDVESEVE